MRKVLTLRSEKSALNKFPTVSRFFGSSISTKQFHTLRLRLRDDQRGNLFLGRRQRYYGRSSLTSSAAAPSGDFITSTFSRYGTISDRHIYHRDTAALGRFTPWRRQLYIQYPGTGYMCLDFVYCSRCNEPVRYTVQSSQSEHVYCRLAVM